MEAGELDVLGPVDYLVVEFPAGKANLSGEMAAELASSWPTAVSRRRPYWPRSKRTPNPNCKEPDMPLARGRKRSPGRHRGTGAAVVWTAAVVKHGHDRRADRLDDRGDRREDRRSIADLGSSGAPFGERRTHGVAA